MASKKCPECGYDIGDPTAVKCPVCNANLSRSMAGVWLIALFQLGAATAFMLLFKFPKFMIVAFGAMIFIGTLVGTTLKARSRTIRPAPPQPVTHPALNRVFGLLIAIVSLALFSTLLFGFVMFMNSWDRWHRYEGQRFHEADFVVKRPYYQKRSKGGPDLYASGTVEGTSEWMGLRQSLQFVPHSQGELEAAIPPGTSIHVYYFPDMKGQARVQVYTDVPPAEASHRDAMKTLNYSLILLGGCGGLLLMLLQMRRLICVETEPSTVRAMAAGQR